MGPVQVQRIGVYARSGIISGKTRCGRLAALTVRVLAGSTAAGRAPASLEFSGEV